MTFDWTMWMMRRRGGILRWYVRTAGFLAFGLMLMDLQNLGLGVLEEKREGDSSSEDDEMGGVGPDGQDRESKDSNVLDKLMGNGESTSKKPTIEEMNQ